MENKKEIERLMIERDLDRLTATRVAQQRSEILRRQPLLSTNFLK